MLKPKLLRRLHSDVPHNAVHNGVEGDNCEMDALRKPVIELFHIELQVSLPASSTERVQHDLVAPAGTMDIDLGRLRHAKQVNLAISFKIFQSWGGSMSRALAVQFCRSLEACPFDASVQLSDLFVQKCMAMDSKEYSHTIGRDYAQ